MVADQIKYVLARVSLDLSVEGLFHPKLPVYTLVSYLFGPAIVEYPHQNEQSQTITIKIMKSKDGALLTLIDS